MTETMFYVWSKIVLMGVLFCAADAAYAQFAAPPIENGPPLVVPAVPPQNVVPPAAIPPAVIPPAAPNQTGARPQLFEECETIARIDGQVVLACDVLWEVNLFLNDKLAQIPPEQHDEAREIVLMNVVKGRDLIDRKLVYADFRRTVPPEAIPRIEKQLAEDFDENHLPKLLKDLKVANREQLELKLHEWGSSLEVVQRSFMERAVVSSWMHEKIKVSEEVTHLDMLDYYQGHIADYSFPTQVKWEELMVRTSQFPTSEAAFGAIAAMGNEVLAQYPVPLQVAGPVFAGVAQAKSQGFTASQGGAHDWTTQGALKAESVDQAIFALPPGQMSQILKSDGGFHIVRVLERREAGRHPFAEVQGKIKEDLKRARFRAEAEKYVSKLRRDAQIWTKYTGLTSAEALMPKRNEERL